MQLYEINQNGNKYCGPSVIAALAGIGTKEAAAIIRAKTKKAYIKGTHATEVQHALNALGFSMTKVWPERVTLQRWAKASRIVRGKSVYLVAAGHHWILVQGLYAQCGKTINLVRIADHPHARCFISEAYRIEKVRNVDPQTVIPVNQPTTTPSDAAARRKAKALAAEHGIEFEKAEPGSSTIWVYPPEGLFNNEEDDPYFEEHYCDADDWKEVITRVQKYVEIIQSKAKG